MRHHWTPVQRTILIGVLAVVLGSLFVSAYSIALGDPVPHRIDAAVVGDPKAHAGTVSSVQDVADDAPGGLSLRRWTAFVVALAVVAPLAFTLVVGTVLNLLEMPLLQSWGILSLQVIAAASFTSLMAVLIGRWAVLPTWLFFVILGNSASGGAVAPPLLPPPLAFVSQWLPSGATVTALREAVYFPADQHAEPLAVLATWATVLFTTMLVVSHRLGRSPGDP